MGLGYSPCLRDFRRRKAGGLTGGVESNGRREKTEGNDVIFLGNGSEGFRWRGLGTWGISPTGASPVVHEYPPPGIRRGLGMINIRK